jgi:hypothetical protein
MDGTLQKRAHSVVDDERSGRPSAVTCVEVKAQIDKRILDYRRISTDEIASEISINHGEELCKNGIRPNRKEPDRTRIFGPDALKA